MALSSRGPLSREHRRCGRPRRCPRTTRTASCATVTGGGVVEVTADVTNTGTVAGDEVTFLFVSYPSTTVRRPAKELKGFVRETVQPGQTVQVTIPLRISDLKYWDTTSSSWKIESGPVTLMVGGSSSNLPLSGALVVQ
jgi:beta-glucosidase